jgi:A/G-specific adenine glycosylase
VPLKPQTREPHHEIAALLLAWYRRHKRDLPWRKTREPYRVWVSEIMLQQTRVAAVIPYYERFLKRFPTVGDLARAKEAELLESWSGLGYYRRVRQMQAAAKQVMTQCGGVFPKTRDELLGLPGIGAYTAAAIASISFAGPHAVVDGNVIRVLARLFDEPGDIGRGKTLARIRDLAQSLIEAVPSRSAGQSNQAVMELGAILCTPRSPRCLLCPVNSLCQARANGVELLRPVKRKKARVERLAMAIAIVRRGSSLLLRQRPADASLMPGFWELPERTAPKLETDCFADLGIEYMEKAGTFRHSITFHEYRGTVHLGRSAAKPKGGYRWIPSKRLDTLPLTTTTRKALACISHKGLTTRK